MFNDMCSLMWRKYIVLLCKDAFTKIQSILLVFIYHYLMLSKSVSIDRSMYSLIVAHMI